MQAMKVLVVMMAVMIVAGVIGLGVVMTRRLSAVPPSLGNVVLDEPTGTRIAGAEAGGEHILLRLEGGGPDRVAVVELRSGRVVGRIGLAR